MIKIDYLSINLQHRCRKLKFTCKNPNVKFMRKQFNLIDSSSHNMKVGYMISIKFLLGEGKGNACSQFWNQSIYLSM